MIKVFSMFSGYGGAEFALKKAGVNFEVVGYSEVDPKCPKCKRVTPHTLAGESMICDVCGSDRKNYAGICYYQNHINYKIAPDIFNKYAVAGNWGDATKIKAEELPDFDLLTGGFPCQSFSVAGKGAGVCDARGTLFWDIWRIAKEKQPKYMLLENVKGLTNKRHKLTFEKILYDLQAIGYHVYWKVLNSKEYGIPQNRERVWFVCIRADLHQEFEFPEKTELKIFLKDILEDEVDEKYYLKPEQVEKLLANGYKQKEISNTMQGGNRQPFILQRGRGRNKGGVKAKDGVSPTISSSKWQDNNHLVSGTRIRKLTPKECFRLMGFLEDGINLEGLSNTQRYKLAGNGWEINVVSKILKNLIK